jgi:hypothetical protein
MPGNCRVSVTGTMMTRFIATSGLQNIRNRCSFSQESLHEAEFYVVRPETGKE